MKNKLYRLFKFRILIVQEELLQILEGKITDFHVFLLKKTRSLNFNSFERKNCVNPSRIYFFIWVKSKRIKIVPPVLFETFANPSISNSLLYSANIKQILFIYYEFIVYIICHEHTSYTMILLKFRTHYFLQFKYYLTINTIQ